MPEAVAVAAAPEEGVEVAEGAAPRQQTTWEVVSGLLTRMFFFWMVMSWMRGDGNKTPTTATTSAGGKPGRNIFPFGAHLDMWVYVNENEQFADAIDAKDLFWKLDDIEFGNWELGPNKDGTFQHSGEIPISEHVQNNGSLFMHAFITRSGEVPFPEQLGGHYQADYVVYRSKQLNRFKKRTIKKTQNLLTGETSTSKELLEHAEKFGNVEVLSHWHPNLTINIVTDQTAWNRANIPAPFNEMVVFDESGSRYQPIVYLNDYWNLVREFQPINSTMDRLPLNLVFQPLSLFKFQMYASQNMRSQWFNFMEEANKQDEDQDAMKEAILETNPYMLGLTVIVSIVHSIFEFLAFKNDIQFWKSRDSLEGLSVRSILFSILQSFIVFLYVLDNDTNFVVRCSIFVGVIIDAWKITKVVNVKYDPTNLKFGFIPINFEDKSTYLESDTKKYDQLAFKYLGWTFFPLLVGYSVYSLLYEEHRGLYSFVLSLLYGFLLTFGFIMMTPQLFINYKLKSVAHLPWRMMTYKALNTFVDDIFAFVIKMPTMYRIGCFRDDIVFFVYLYQRYKYRVDPKRVNEFGTSGEAPEQQPAVDGPAVEVPAVEAPAVEVPTVEGAVGEAPADKKND